MTVDIFIWKDSETEEHIVYLRERGQTRLEELARAATRQEAQQIVTDLVNAEQI